MPLLPCLLKPYCHLHVGIARHVQIALKQLRHHLHDCLEHAADRVCLKRQTRYVLARRNEYVSLRAPEYVDAV